MKKIYLSFLFMIAVMIVKATSYTVAISGTTYSPNTLTVTVGDVVTIMASPNHPLVEVDQSTWNANGATPSGTGFGTKNANYTFTVSSTNTIYYVCQFHVSMGMKGQIVVNSATGVSEINNALASVSVFPNPTNHKKFSLKFNTSESLNLDAKLYSVCGQEVASVINQKEFSAGSNNVQVDLPQELPAGIYLLQIKYHSTTLVKKLIVD